MKKIDSCDHPLDIGFSVLDNMGQKAAKGVDIYQDDDGSIRIFPHKIDYDEAEQVAINWLNQNNAGLVSDNIYYGMPFDRVVFCAYRSYNDGIKTGLAKFNWKDKRYSWPIGKALAYSRASGKKLPADLAEYLGIKQ